MSTHGEKQRSLKTNNRNKRRQNKQSRRINGVLEQNGKCSRRRGERRLTSPRLLACRLRRIRRVAFPGSSRRRRRLRIRGSRLLLFAHPTAERTIAGYTISILAGRRFMPDSARAEGPCRWCRVEFRCSRGRWCRRRVVTCLSLRLQVFLDILLLFQRLFHIGRRLLIAGSRPSCSLFRVPFFVGGEEHPRDRP